MAKQLVRRSARRIELRSLNPEHPDFNFDLADVAWMHRIIWLVSSGIGFRYRLVRARHRAQ